MENENTTTVASVQNTESYFDGGVFQRLGWKILGSLVTGITLGICYPFAVCWLYAWEAKHTVIDGRRLKFTGNAGGLFGTWIVCLLLSIVTCGIYAFYVPIKIKRWRESNTFFEDEIPTFDAVQKLKSEKASRFDGGFWQLFGWELLGGFLTLCTLGICYPLAVKMVYSWEQRHKVYCKRRCTFDGTAGSLFGTWIVCLLLTIITVGIYSWWIPIRVKKWQIKHTHLLGNDSPAEEQENKGLSAEEIAAKNEKIFKWFYLVGAALVLASLFIYASRHPIRLLNIGGITEYYFRSYVRRRMIVEIWIPLICAIAMIVLSFVKIPKGNIIKVIPIGLLVICRVCIIICIIILYHFSLYDIFLRFSLIGFVTSRRPSGLSSILSYILDILRYLLVYAGFALSLIGWIKIDLKEIKKGQISKDKAEK